MNPSSQNVGVVLGLREVAVYAAAASCTVWLNSRSVRNGTSNAESPMLRVAAIKDVFERRAKGVRDFAGIVGLSGPEHLRCR